MSILGINEISGINRTCPTIEGSVCGSCGSSSSSLKENIFGKFIAGLLVLLISYYIFKIKN